MTRATGKHAADDESARPTYEELVERVAQLERQQQQQSFVELVESIQDGFLALDRDWRFTYVNCRAAENVGFSPADLVGRNMWELFPTLVGTEQEAAHRRAMSERVPVSIEVRGTLANRWYRLGISPTANGLAVVWTDITERKRAEEKLAFQANLLANITDVVYSTDAQLRITSWNRAAEKCYGWKEEEVLGRSVFEVVRSEFDPQRRAALTRELTKTGAISTEIKHSTRSGETAVFLSTTTLLRDEGGQVLGFLSVNSDITERRRAEDALRFHAAELEAVLDAQRDVVIEYDRAMNVKRANASFRALHGFDPEGLNVRDIIQRVSCREVDGSPLVIDEQPTPLALRGKQVAGRTFIVSRADGSEAVVETSATPLRSGDEVVGSVAAWHDISERKRAEGALRESEHKYRSIFENSMDAIILAVPGHQLIAANPAACAMFQMTEEELLRAGRKGIEEPADNRHNSAAEERARKGRVKYEGTHVRKDGSRFPSEVSSVVMDGGTRSLVIIRDNTERKRAEEALRRSEERHRSVLENMSEGLVMFDRAGAITYQNPASERIHDGRLTGQRRRLDQLAVNWGVRKYPDGDVVPSDQWAIPRVLRGERVLHELFFVDCLEDPERSFVGIYSGCPAYDDQGELAYGFLTIEDITDQARAEGALRQANETLREADQRKTEFLGVLSHELRNPLTPIRNSLYILDRAAPGGEQARRAHSVIDRQVNHFARLVDDLLDVTRISRGKIRLQRARLDLVDVVRRTVEDHRSLLERHEVAVELPKEAIWVDGDPTRLAQVLGNLLNNAAKFTPEGGRVLVSLSRAEGRAVLEVADTGMGIDAETLKRLFEPFAQADRSLDRSRGGLGLGLALVKGMVELHGGEVSVHSDGPGTGARLTITIPLDERGVVLPTLSGGQAKTRVRTILIIEDNMDAADSLSEVLELSGHQVAVAYDGEAGVKKAREFCPEIILCDIGLPAEMDGYAVARALRRDPATASAYLVALTGYAQPEDQRRALNAGFDAHLAKPPDLAALERLLAQVPARAARTGGAPPIATP